MMQQGFLPVLLADFSSSLTIIGATVAMLGIVFSVVHVFRTGLKVKFKISIGDKQVEIENPNAEEIQKALNTLLEKKNG